MSKKHKKKHKHGNKSHAVNTSLPPTPPPSHELVEVVTPKLNSRISFWLYFSVLLLGVLVGALGTSLVVAAPASQELTAATLLEDKTEADILEHVANEVKEGMTAEEEAKALEFLVATSSSRERSLSPQAVKIPVLVYHSVRPRIEGESKYQDQYDVTPELLDQELTHLERNGFHTILMRDVDAYWKGNLTTLPENPIILTFDDGWRNQYEYAFPLLKKHNMKAVFYVFTNPVDHEKAHWMSWEQIIELDKAGMEIGGHTRTHPVLTKIDDNTKLDKEILEPKKIIESHIGHPISTFAYPFGQKNERVVLGVARAGYSIARTIDSGVWNDPEHRLDFHGTLASDNIKEFEALLRKQ